MLKITRSVTDGKAVGADGVPVELLKIAFDGDPVLLQRLLDNDVGIWSGDTFHSGGNMPPSCSTKRI